MKEFSTAKNTAVEGISPAAFIVTTLATSVSWSKRLSTTKVWKTNVV